MKQAGKRRMQTNTVFEFFFRRTRAGLAAFALFLGILIGVDRAHAETITITAFGDSLTAGYGLAPEDAFPVVLEEALRAKGHDVTIINSGVSGDTTTAGRDRLEWSLDPATDGVILELGANDALRGISPSISRENLDWMVETLVGKGHDVLIAGMVAPPNLGRDYAGDFNPIFADLAEQYETLLYPFFLDGVAAEASLNQSDGIHPNRAGVDVIVERILPSVEALIARIENNAS